MFHGGGSDCACNVESLKECGYTAGALAGAFCLVVTFLVVSKRYEMCKQCAAAARSLDHNAGLPDPNAGRLRDTDVAGHELEDLRPPSSVVIEQPGINEDITYPLAVHVHRTGYGAALDIF